MFVSPKVAEEHLATFINYDIRTDLFFFWPTGQAATHIPHILASIPSRVHPNSAHWSRHLNGSKNSSLSVVISQSLPFAAFAGQISTQILQFPHLLVSTGLDFDLTGVFKRIETSRSLGPNSLEMKRSVFPIQPNPALVATILWERSVERVSKYICLFWYILWNVHPHISLLKLIL